MYEKIVSKLIQWGLSIGGGLLVAFETSLNFFIPCFFIVLLDVWTAYRLGVRIHKKHPDKADGKFKSEYKFRILVTMLVIFILIIIANYVDIHVLKNPDSGFAVRFVVAVFVFYQVWSILENWSSENDKKVAKALQRIMVDKTSRHLNVPLEDIFFDEKRKENEDEPK